MVSNAGDYDKTEVYFYDGQRIVQINNGSGTMVQQFIHGTQYIDELVMMRVKGERSERERAAIGKASTTRATGPRARPQEASTRRATEGKGDLYVHQDANWNVIGTTDLGRHIVERNVYTPYGELTVHQDTGFGDRDGDQDVDSTDKGTVGTTCTGTVSGSCRILDLDFDGDYDSTDVTKFDALPQGAMRHPGRPSTNVSQPFAHQGLLFEPELAQLQNRKRQYDPARRRFLQADPLAIRTRFDVRAPYQAFEGLSGFRGGLNLYAYLSQSPLDGVDPLGLQRSGTHPDVKSGDVGFTVGCLIGRRVFNNPCLCYGTVPCECDTCSDWCCACPGANHSAEECCRTGCSSCPACCPPTPGP